MLQPRQTNPFLDTQLLLCQQYNIWQKEKLDGIWQRLKDMEDLLNSS